MIRGDPFHDLDQADRIPSLAKESRTLTPITHTLLAFVILLFRLRVFLQVEIVAW